jgi:opine dehydrogenase
MLNIAVYGDGGIAASIAAIACLSGHHVRYINQTIHGFQCNDLRCMLPGEYRFTAHLSLITDKPEIGLAQADIVFICVDHSEVDNAFKIIVPYLPKNALIGGVPGFGGFGILARRHLAGHIIFGLQRIPFVVRDYTPTAGVQIGGVRRQTFVGTMPADRSPAVADLLRAVLGVPVVPMPHYLNVELSPSNSIVNPARLYTLFGSPHLGCYPSPKTEFFADWDLSSSIALLSLDRELRLACGRIPRDTCFVAPILFQYDANNAETLTHRIRGLSALHGRRIPLDTIGDKPFIATSSSYFQQDLDIGLILLKKVFGLAAIETPLTDDIIAWRRSTVAEGHVDDWDQRSDLSHFFASLDDLAEWLD